MANVENIEVENPIANTRSGIIASSSNALDKIREGIDQPGFRRAFPTLLASVTAVAAIILYWGMQQPDMTTLYSSLPEAEKSKVLDSLRNMGVEVELDPVTGDILVPLMPIINQGFHWQRKGYLNFHKMLLMLSITCH